MLKEKIRRWIENKLDDSAIRENEEMIGRNNLQFYILFNYIMIVLLSLLYISTLFSNYAKNLISVYGIFIGLSIVEIFIIHFNKKRSSMWIGYATYFGIIKAYTFCILTSVVFNRNDSAITIFIFMILIPVSFLIRPVVMYIIQFLVVIIFCSSTVMLKSPEYVAGDIISCVLFFMISLVISDQIQRLRLDNISMAGDERKHSRELEIQRNLLGVAMESANMSAWEYDSHTKIMALTYMPDYFECFGEVHENMPESIIEQNLVHPGSVEILRKLFQMAQQGERVIQGDVRLRLEESQKYGWYHINMSPENTDERNPVRYVGIFEEITERKNMELQYAEQLRILDNTNDGNLIMKGRWNISTNRQIVEERRSTMGLELQHFQTYDQAMCALTDAIFPEEKRKEMVHHLRRENLLGKFRKGVDKLDFEYQRLAGNHTAIWVSMQIRMCQVPGSEDVMCFGFSYDISEEMLNKSIIDQLVSSEYDFLATINVKSGTTVVRMTGDTAIDLVKKVNAYNCVTDYEESVAAAARYTIVEAEQSEMIEAMRLQKVLRRLEQNRKYMVTFSVTEHDRERRKKLEYCYLDDTKETILCYRSDITELYLQEQKQLDEMKEAIRQVEEANMAKTDFLSRMSHDMRTPMNGIIGMTRMTQEMKDVPEEVRRNLDAISDSSNYLLSLINDTLDMSRIEQKKVALSSNSIDAKELMRHILAMIRHLADDKKLDIIYESDMHEQRFIRADRVRLQQIILNILSNAVKFTPEGGSVRITSECLGVENQIAHDKIVIADTGIGMSKEFLRKIYEPFSQENSELTNRQVGTGLGMSIVKNLVELMGGSIDIQSELGKGTTVTLLLNFELGEPEEEKSETNKKDISRILKGKRILLVEDHPLNMTIAKSVLGKMSMLVETAEDGRQALDLFAMSSEGYYDAILMDIRMPHMDGLQATSAIRALRRSDAKTIPIVAMSANAFDEDIEKSKEVGMNDHLSKPMNPELVYETLAEYL